LLKQRFYACFCVILNEMGKGIFFVKLRVHNSLAMKKLDTVFTIICSAGLCLLLISQFAFKSNANANRLAGNNMDEWKPPVLPREFSFAGEEVPLKRWDVKERLDREVLFNSYNQANIIFLIKLSNRYFPVISERLKANGVPDDFKYLCIAESNLLPGAVSGAGATGFWQFMSGTAPGYGLEANAMVDERMDVTKSTDAASQYLKQAYTRFGTWTAAAASYNCGMGGYNSQATFQQTKNYYDLHLPEETNRYIFRILAFKYILENAEALGFKVAPSELYSDVPHRVVSVTSSITNLAQFAIDNGTSYKVLRLMNPWIRGKSLNVKAGKSYIIKLPAPSQ
jgi:membrane-bound lytic murein transglycosylase D